MSDFHQRAIFVAVLALAVLVLTIGFRFIAQTFLVAFTGLLVAVALTGPSEWLARRTRLGRSLALALVILTLLLVVLGGASLFGYQIAEQADRLSRSLKEASQQVEQTLRHTQWGRWILNGSGSLMQEGAQLASGASVIMSSTVYVVAVLVVVFFIGAYVAAEPGLYEAGLIELFPLRHQARAREITHAVGGTLQWWLLGQCISMTIIGTLTTLGLLLLGAPFPLALGILAGVLTFVPNVGPTLSLVPAVLLSMMQGPRLAIWVVLLYLGVQTVESYFVTPLVQRRTIYLPPALTITSQFLLWILAGSLGLVVATPLTAAILVLVRRLYLGNSLH